MRGDCHVEREALEELKTDRQGRNTMPELMNMIRRSTLRSPPWIPYFGVRCAQSFLSRRRPLLGAGLRRTAQPPDFPPDFSTRADVRFMAQPPGLATKANFRSTAHSAFASRARHCGSHSCLASMVDSCHATKAGCTTALLLPELALADRISCPRGFRI